MLSIKEIYIKEAKYLQSVFEPIGKYFHLTSGHPYSSRNALARCHNNTCTCHLEEMCRRVCSDHFFPLG